MNELVCVGSVLLVLGVTLDSGQYMTMLQSWSSTFTGVLYVQQAADIQSGSKVYVIATYIWIKLPLIFVGGTYIWHSDDCMHKYFYL